MQEHTRLKKQHTEDMKKQNAKTHLLGMQQAKYTRPSKCKQNIVAMKLIQENRKETNSQTHSSNEYFQASNKNIKGCRQENMNEANPCIHLQCLQRDNISTALQSAKMKIVDKNSTTALQ